MVSVQEQIICVATKTVIKGKFIALNAHIRKTRNSYTKGEKVRLMSDCPQQHS